MQGTERKPLEGCPALKTRKQKGCSATLHVRCGSSRACGTGQRPWASQDLAEQSPRAMPTAPHVDAPRGRLRPKPSPASRGEQEPAPAPGARGAAARWPSPAARSRGRQLVPGRRRALAARARSEIPSRGCPSPRARRLPAQAARGEGGDWCREAHVTDPGLSSCPKMGSSSHEQAAVPHRAADKQKTDSISTK